MVYFAKMFLNLKGTFLLSANIKTKSEFLTNSKKMNSKTYLICFTVHFFTIFAL